jgi:site-specific recombinase XerD
MSQQSDRVLKGTTASPELHTAYQDFILSRHTVCRSKRTIIWYEETLSWVLEWMTHNGVSRPADFTARHVRAYIQYLQTRTHHGKPLSDQYIHNQARTIRTFFNFLYNEKYIPEPIKFQMPRIEDRRLLCLDADQVAQLLKACESIRDRALLLTFIDTGARLQEVINMNWEDVNVSNGIVNIPRGKGGKGRSVVVGTETRRALLAYRREIGMPAQGPLFLTRDGNRFMRMGIRDVLTRLAQKTGIKVTPHALRRTFATLSLRAGMNPLQLQALLGHTTLDMTRRYIQMVDEDLVNAHREHGPIDNILRKR